VNNISQIRKERCSTPLDIRRIHIEQEMFKSLIKSALRRGISLKGKDCFGYTPLYSTVLFNEKIEMIRLLFENGADPNIRNDCEETVLHFAVSFNEKIETIRLLLKNGADPNNRDNCGETALHWAVLYNEKIEIIRLLFKNGADSNIQNNHGRIPPDLSESRAITELLQKA